jgi:NAD-dependent SIR2 family protein deacetylase
MRFIAYCGYFVGASLIIVNNTDTYIDVRADIIIRADVAEIFPQISDEVLNA